MGNCKDLERLFGPQTVRVVENQQLESHHIHTTDDFYFKGETLFFQGSISRIRAIYELTDGEFRLLYQRPDPMPDIQTGDFVRNDIGDVGVVVNNKVYYKDGGFDKLSSIIKPDNYIAEVRRPRDIDCGFNGYSKMPIIWPKN